MQKRNKGIGGRDTVTVIIPNCEENQGMNAEGRGILAVRVTE